MKILNIEIKARTSRPGEIESILKKQGADFNGEDHQIDTYFDVASGRLKLREGRIEKSLILYHRIETKGLKRSDVLLQKLGSENLGLKNILSTILGIKTVVDKKRKIYFIDNVKFHIDHVEGLGAFVEIEAIDVDGSIGEENLRAQCDHYVSLLGIDPSDFINQSYSDMI